MGMGGFHIHCRVGLDTEYLGTEFFSCVEACEKKAKEEGFFVIFMMRIGGRPAVQGGL